MERPLIQIPLSTLAARFVRVIRPDDDPPLEREDVYGLQDGADYAHGLVDTLARAEGVRFACPRCYSRKGCISHCHIVLCWFEGAPENVRPGPGRWRAIGTDVRDLTFIPGSGLESVRLAGGCGWHGFIRHGFATLSVG